MQQIHAINFAPFAPRGAFAGPEAAGELCRMQALTGADAVIFCPGAVQTGPFVEEIDFTGRHTTSDEELLAMTQLAHDRGMRVFWKPAVNCLDGTWRARISFFDHDVPCETKWSGWFASYQAFQLHFAALAQQAGADMLILGCEMTQAERREAEWRRLIAAVRSVYAGAVSYNCDKYGEEHVSWVGRPGRDRLQRLLPHRPDRPESGPDRAGGPAFPEAFLLCRGRLHADRGLCGRPQQLGAAGRAGPGRTGPLVQRPFDGLPGQTLVWRHRLLGLAAAGPCGSRPVRLYPGACAGSDPRILLCREMKVT